MKRSLWIFIIAVSCSISLSGNEPAIYHKSRGDYFYRLKQIPDAILQYQQALKKSPAFTECYFYLGKIYMEQGQFAIAIANFRHVLLHRSRLVDKSMILDTYFHLANAWHKTDTIRSEPDQRPGLIKMIEYIDRIIKAFTSDPDFMPSKKQRRYSINKHYYLAKALFIKARYKRDLRQDHEYRDLYEASFKEMKLDLENYFPNIVLEKPRYDFIKQLLKLKQEHPDKWGRAKPLIINMSYCLYFIWEYNYHKGNYARAARYRSWARMLNPVVLQIRLDEPYFKIFKKPTRAQQKR